jgi:hemoglobin-like flavoprotein
LNQRQKILVQESFTRVLPIAALAADIFYGRLFQLAPALRPLFSADLEDQGHKLMKMLAYCVGALDDLPVLIPALQDLGRRHGTYGVAEAHYDTVGEALLWTLARGLGDAFTPEVQEAWTELYRVMAATMTGATAPLQTTSAASGSNVVR